MALNLKLGTIVQSNDATIIRVSDGTGEYPEEFSGWGHSGFTPTPAQITAKGGDNELLLQVTITTSDGVETEYEDIDLYTQFGPFSTADDLVFDITPAMLIKNDIALGANDDAFPDGIYVFTYKFDSDTGLGNDISNSVEVFIEGSIRAKIYEKLRDIPYSSEFKFMSNDFKEWNSILNPIYYYSLFQGMLAEVSTARRTEVLNILNTLQRLCN